MSKKPKGFESEPFAFVFLRPSVKVKTDEGMSREYQRILRFLWSQPNETALPLAIRATCRVPPKYLQQMLVEQLIGAWEELYVATGQPSRVEVQGNRSAALVLEVIRSHGQSGVTAWNLCGLMNRRPTKQAKTSMCSKLIELGLVTCRLVPLGDRKFASVACSSRPSAKRISPQKGA